MRVVATAGHVDHGKSTLVKALTGVDPDRWPEEKARGLTIDLGFAVAQLPSGEEIGFVDVPGHVRFVKNMLAGVSSVDACLFVVAANEGWKPQSEEHLRILGLLGVRHGVVALTKVALVDGDERELAAMEVQDHLRGTFLERSELVAVDVVAGAGTEQLRTALDRLVTTTPAAADRGWPRLWVDRSFPVRGAGTILTGTLTGGCFSVGDDLEIDPGGTRARVRALQSHHASVQRAAPGRRLAVNLTGVPHEQVRRGHALVQPGQWRLTRTVDASLEVLASVGHPVMGKGAFSAHIGAGSFPVRLRVIGRSTKIEPGGEGPVRLWLDANARLPLLPGDRYVLREAGRGETLGGGEILDVAPVLAAARAAPSRSPERVVRERGWVGVAELARLTGRTVEPTLGRWVVDPPLLAQTREEISQACRGAGARGVPLAGFSQRQRIVLATGVAGVRVDADRAVAEGSASPALSEGARQVLGQLEAARWSPPALPIADRAALRELERKGEVVQAGELWFAASAVDAAVEALAGLLSSRPDGFTVAAARDALASSRKHVLPLLGLLDSMGFTRRRGELRVAGPQMPVASTGAGRISAGAG
ncbi:MAG: selenocysteine-specific translation elongation factor [Acidimicrobiales bacterium]